MSKEEQMKKIKIITLFLFLFILCIPHQIEAVEEEVLESQKSNLNISDFVSEAEKYTKENFGDLNINELLNSAIKGEVDNETIFKQILSKLGGEVTSLITVLGSILVIIVVHSILKAISENLGNKSISQIIYYVQYILIVTLIMANFTQIIQMTKEAIENLVGFMNCLVPVLMTLMLATGSITSVGVIEPVILFLINFISNLLNTIILPLVLVITVLAIISKVSDKIQIDKLAKFGKSSIVWILGIILTIFVGVVSLEGSLTSSVDGITAKATKAAVSNFIPVVGKVLGDAVDTVLGCSLILKNAVGVVGVIVLIGICILPILKLGILTISYHLAAAVCQPIADEKIVKLLEQMGDTFKILLAILFSISVMFIIGTTIVIKISNSGMMYR